jgi:hypothetical protein
LYPAVFHPQLGQAFNPGTLGLAYEDVWVQSVDGVLIHGWYLPAKGRASGMVMFLHGNAKNVSAYLKNVQWLPSHGFNVFMLEYRRIGIHMANRRCQAFLPTSLPGSPRYSAVEMWAGSAS